MAATLGTSIRRRATTSRLPLVLVLGATQCLLIASAWAAGSAGERVAAGTDGEPVVESTGDEPAVAGDTCGPGAPRSSVECGTTLAFARSLEREGEYYRAITEYMRYRFVCADPHDPESGLAIARCLYGAGALSDVAELGEAVAGPQDSPIGARLRFLAGVGRYELGSYWESAEDFRTALAWGRDSPLAGPSAVNWGLALARERRFDEAREALGVALDDPLVAADALDCLERVNRASALPNKSKSVARALAIVPGAGYAYGEHWQTALVTATVLGLSGWGLAAAVEDENTGAAVLLGFFTLTWYAGSIHGSGQAAVRWNAKSLSDELDPAEPLVPSWVLEFEDSP
jgi:hypothetical protein